MAEFEDEDNFPNDFDGLDFENVPGLQAPTISTRTPEVTIPSALPRNIVPSTAASPVPSTGSNNVVVMDPSFLAAIDALEARALGEMVQGSETSSCAESDGHTDAKKLFSTNRKGKRKAEPHEGMDIRALLEGYETDLTCPICCDLFVGAQVANPCGHTCCGECSNVWFARNKYEPTCAVCRSSLSTRKPLLPNFSADNLVQQHLLALAKSGRPEWQEKGYKTIEWNKRLESWKEQVAVRAAKEKTKETARLRRRRRYYEVGEYSYAAPWGIDESMEDSEDSLVARVLPRRGTRSRH